MTVCLLNKKSEVYQVGIWLNYVEKSTKKEYHIKIRMMRKKGKRGNINEKRIICETVVCKRSR